LRALGALFPRQVLRGRLQRVRQAVAALPASQAVASAVQPHLPWMSNVI